MFESYERLASGIFLVFIICIHLRIYVGFLARARVPADVHLNGPVRQCCHKSPRGTEVME